MHFAGAGLQIITGARQTAVVKLPLTIQVGGPAGEGLVKDGPNLLRCQRSRRRGGWYWCRWRWGGLESKQRAVVAVMRKLVRAAFHVAKGKDRKSVV